MGKGDMKTRRGKLFSGSFGVLRPRKRKNSLNVVSTTKKVNLPEEEPVASKPITAAPKKEAEFAKAEIPTVETPVEVIPEVPVVAGEKHKSKEAKAPEVKTKASGVETPVESIKHEAKKPAAKKTEEAPKKKS